MLIDFFEEMIDEYWKDPKRGAKVFESTLSAMPNASETLREEFEQDLRAMKDNGFDLLETIRQIEKNGV
jgi:BMFP domain-containing protein YqiC